MKREMGWFTLFCAAIALASLSREFILRLVCGDYLAGIIFVSALSISQILDWVWHLPLRRVDVSISCDPLKPNTGELCQYIRDTFRRIYSEGGRYLVYIAPMPNTGMRIAFNLAKQRIEAKCGSELFPADESNYQLPPFVFDESPVVYRLSGGVDECVDGAYLLVSAKRGEKLFVSKLRVSKLASLIVDVIFVILGILLNIGPIILGAILLRRTHVSNVNGIWKYLIIGAAIVVIAWQFYHLYW